MVMMTREDYYAQIEAEDRRFREYLMLRNDDDDETWTETDWWYRSKKENPENQICNDEEYSSQISDSLSFNRPDPKPIYEIKADKEIPKASSKSKRRYKLQKRISCEELDERTMKGLCVFCEEPETPGHYLQHPNSCLLMIDSEDHLSDSMVNKIGNPEEQALDDGELVETEVVTESDGIEQQTVNNEENANENLDILEEESITQIQVPVSSLESSLQFHNASSDICDDFKSSLFGHQEAMLQVSHVKVRDELLTKSTDVTSNQAAHYLFDKMSLRVQSKRRHLKCHKSWMFKFKQRKQHRGKPRTAHKLMNRENVMEDYHVYQEGLPLWLLVRFKFWKFKFINRKLQKMMREHGYSSHLKLKSDVGEDDEMFTGAKAVSMRFLLGIMLGITESDAGQGQQAEFEQVVMTNVWLQTSLVTQQVLRSKKIKFPKRWMFKYKYVEEDIKSLHNQLSYMSRLELEERFKSWSQRETVEAKQNLKNWYDDSLLEFLKRIEAGSSMIMILYNNTELINYLYHLEKSCLVSIIRIENALIEARFVKTMEEYSKNHLASTLAYELFHSPRPPELFVADRMIATKEETEEVMKESDQKQQGEWSHYFLLVAAANWSPQMNLWSTSYHVWHRWKARYCFVGIISTMWAWLFGEEGFDTVKRSIKNRTRGRGRLEAINGPGSNKTKNKRRQKLFI